MNKNFLFSLGIFFILVLKFAFFFKINSNDNLAFTGDSQKYLDLSKNFTQTYLENELEFLEIGLRFPPAYPALIGLIKHIELVIFTQLIFGLLINYFVYKSIIVITKNFRIAKLGFIFSLIETSLFTSVLQIMSETFFTFFISIGLYYTLQIISSNHKRLLNLFYSSLAFSCASYFRGIGFIIVFTLFFVAIFNFKKLKVLISLSLIILIFISPMIFRVYSLTNQVATTTSQSEIVLYYDGAAAVAMKENRPLKDIQNEELFRQNTLVDSYNYKEKYDYMISRGTYLISKNFSEFLSIHALGIVKVLLGPSQSSFMWIISGGKYFLATNIIEKIIVSFCFMITFLLFIFAMFGITKIKSEYRYFFLIFILFFVVSSSAVGAYSRFRVPLNPALSILAAIGAYHLIEIIKKYKVLNSLRVKLRNYVRPNF